jgi:hypothetical protein
MLESKGTKLIFGDFAGEVLLRPRTKRLDLLADDFIVFNFKLLPGREGLDHSGLLNHPDVTRA